MKRLEELVISKGCSKESFQKEYLPCIFKTELHWKTAEAQLVAGLIRESIDESFLRESSYG